MTLYLTISYYYNYIDDRYDNAGNRIAPTGVLAADTHKSRYLMALTNVVWRYNILYDTLICRVALHDVVWHFLISYVTF